jgi:hypothetical protein
VDLNQYLNGRGYSDDKIDCIARQYKYSYDPEEFKRLSYEYADKCDEIHNNALLLVLGIVVGTIVTVFVCICCMYLIVAVCHRKEIMEEWRNMDQVQQA